MGWEELQPLRQGAPLSRLAQRDCLEGGGWREWNKGLLMGAFLGPGRGWEHPDICVRPQPPLLLGLDSNLRVGGRGRENPLVLSPSPSRPGSSASQRPSRPGHTHPRTHTPTGLTIAHTYIHTAAANKGSGHPVPFRHTPSGEGGAFPPQVPYEVSLCLRAAVGRRTRCPGGRGPGRRGSPAPQECHPPGRPSRASGLPPS